MVTGHAMQRSSRAKLAKELAGRPLSTTGTARRNISTPQSLKEGPDVWVTNWVDYSTKYGLGYLLSNGAVGVFYNDSSKIISHEDGDQFEYLTRNHIEK